MSDALGPVLICGAVIGVFVRLLSPTASRSVRWSLPLADRPIDRTVSGQRPRRGAVLAALVAAEAADVWSRGSAVSAGSLIVLLAVLGVAYQAWPDGVGPVIGFAGAASGALAIVEARSCFGEEASPTLGIAFLVGGSVLFLTARLAFRLCGLALGNPISTLLMLAGIVQLSAFAARPYGGDLRSLVGTSSISAVFGLFGLVVLLAAAVPGFASSVVGVSLLAANVAASGVEGSCFDGARTVVLAAVGFGVASFAAAVIRRRVS